MKMIYSESPVIGLQNFRPVQYPKKRFLEFEDKATITTLHYGALSETLQWCNVRGGEERVKELFVQLWINGAKWRFSPDMYAVSNTVNEEARVGFIACFPDKSWVYMQRWCHPEMSIVISIKAFENLATGKS